VNGEVVVTNATNLPVSRDRAIVCKHWLRKQCKRGKDCGFLHEIITDKMPPCQFFDTWGVCNNPDCTFRHIRPEDKKNECEWYARGHCKHGNRCRNRHTKRTMCKNYYAGFCPLGPNCTDGHPKFELPSADGQRSSRTPIICHKCRESGHKAAQCPNSASLGEAEDRKPIEDVTCYKCGGLGHYANRCPAGCGGKAAGGRGNGIGYEPYAMEGAKGSGGRGGGKSYKTRMCKFAIDGQCKNGAGCTYVPPSHMSHMCDGSALSASKGCGEALLGGTRGMP
jgi:cleavage and polyadenylation specificity factor subunit 4